MFTLVLGIGASVATIHPMVGLIINVAIIFCIVYQGMHNYKMPIYFPFLLTYIFMIMSAPTDFKGLPLRMGSIVIGCLYIALIQLVFNRNRLNKTILGTRKAMIANIARQVDSLLENDYKPTLNIEMDALVDTMAKAIYDTRLKSKHITSANKGNLELAMAKQQLGRVLHNFSEKEALTEEEKELLVGIREITHLLDEYFYSDVEKNKTQQKIDEVIQKLNVKISDKRIKEVVQTLKSFPDYLEMIEDKKEHVLNTQKLTLKNGLKRIDRDTATFKFAIKMALAISLVIFLVDSFHITYGRWIVFPMIAIIQPHYDGTVKKAIDRIIGTVIGIVLFTILFSIVKDNSVRMNLVILLAYINLFMKKYHISTSLVAVSALGGATMGGAGIEILAFRILFTIIGCAIALIINRYILYYTLEDFMKDLAMEYTKDVKELKLLNHTIQDEYKKYNIILKAKLMEYKINQYRRLNQDNISL
ncbi:MAG: FUSC family protein [Cellulosilyticaceae bacterium]